jgi:hypothetical protein
VLGASGRAEKRGRFEAGDAGEGEPLVPASSGVERGARLEEVRGETGARANCSRVVSSGRTRWGCCTVFGSGLGEATGVCRSGSRLGGVSFTFSTGRGLTTGNGGGTNLGIESTGAGRGISRAIRGGVGRLNSGILGICGAAAGTGGAVGRGSGTSGFGGAGVGSGGACKSTSTRRSFSGKGCGGMKCNASKITPCSATDAKTTAPTPFLRRDW